MILLRLRFSPRKVTRSLFIVVSLLILLSSLGSTEAAVYYTMTLENQATTSSPPVELQEGTAQNSTSTIYANSTSAKVSVAPSGTGSGDSILYVDNNTSDIDDSADKGSHSNLQLKKPDQI